MATQDASDFISNYDSFFAPPVEGLLYSPDADRPRSAAARLVTFLIRLPSWIIAFVVAAVIYAQVFQTTVAIGPIQIRPVLAGSPIAVSAANEDIKPLAQKLDALAVRTNELSKKVAALSTHTASALVPPQVPAHAAIPAAVLATDAIASAPVAPEVPVQAAIPAPTLAWDAPPSASPPDAIRDSSKPRSGGKMVLGAAVRNFLTRAIALGTGMSSEITSYAREHGGSLGQERARFVNQRDHWINSSYDFIREFVGRRYASDFMNGDSPSALDSNGSDAARLVNSLHGRVAVLRKLLAGSTAPTDRDT
jgi:hypothetical protein